MADVLDLLPTTVAADPLLSNLTELGKHIATEFGGDPLKQIRSWRNEAVHQTTTPTAIAGFILSYASLIALDGVREDYHKLQTAAIERIIACDGQHPSVLYPVEAIRGEPAPPLSSVHGSGSLRFGV